MAASTESVKSDTAKLENDKKIMRGEFRGDFTRDTFDPMKAFSRVLMQQGRVQVDADWNEQVSIMLHSIRSLACDVGSEHWGPGLGSTSGTITHNDKKNAGFQINIIDGVNNNFTIGAGHYYVKGILCEARLGKVPESDKIHASSTYLQQPNYPEPQSIDSLISSNNNSSLLVYLDVWERHITHLNDDTIREVALGGTDTTTRAQIIWQIKVIPILDTSDLKEQYSKFLNTLMSANQIKSGTGKLYAKVKNKERNDTDPCLVAPESRYRGTENQLYRVEIHNSNVPEGKVATFKWSRENASVIFPVVKIEENHIILEYLGRDCRYGLKANDWVEIVDDDSVLRGEPGQLVQINDVIREDLMVTYNEGALLPIYTPDDCSAKHVFLRRWDQSTGDNMGIPIPVEHQEPKNLIDLENGIQIHFEINHKAVYQTGDYWLIPARTAKRDVEWPIDDTGEAIAQSPHGVIHHYAPLATIPVNGGALGDPTDLRRIMKHGWK